MFAVYTKMWTDFLRRPLDEMPHEGRRILENFKPLLLNGDWFNAYDLVEFLLTAFPSSHADTFRESVVTVLKEEHAGFQLVGSQFVEMSDEREIAAIEAALEIAVDKFTPIRAHLDAALTLYSDRHTPDYRNSVKESISAVEASVQILTGDSKAELGKALAQLQSKAPIHGAFASALKSLYGYTSDANGIRHSLSDESTLDSADAKFMLVACSAFVVYLIQKSLL